MSKSKSNKTCKDYFEIAYVYVITELPFKFLNNSIIFNITLAFINLIIVPLCHCVYKSRNCTT